MKKRWESLKQKLKPGRGNQAAQPLEAEAEAEAAPDPAINEDATAALTAQLLRFNSTFSAYTSQIINTSKMSQNHLSKMMGAQEALGDTIETLRWRERTKSPQNLEIRYNLCLSILEQMEELAIGVGRYNREQDQTGIEARIALLENWLSEIPKAEPTPTRAPATGLQHTTLEQEAEKGRLEALEKQLATAAQKNPEALITSLRKIGLPDEKIEEIRVKQILELSEAKEKRKRLPLSDQITELEAQLALIGDEAQGEPSHSSKVTPKELSSSSSLQKILAGGTAARSRSSSMEM